MWTNSADINTGIMASSPFPKVLTPSNICLSNFFSRLGEVMVFLRPNDKIDFYDKAVIVNESRPVYFRKFDQDFLPNFCNVYLPLSVLDAGISGLQAVFQSGIQFITRAKHKYTAIVPV